MSRSRSGEGYCRVCKIHTVGRSCCHSGVGGGHGGYGADRPADIWPDAPYTSDDSYAAVNCSDKPFDIRPNELPREADRWERQMPDFGRYLAWGDPAVSARD